MPTKKKGTKQPKSPEPRAAVLSLLVEPALAGRISEFARRRDQSVSAVIRSAAKFALENKIPLERTPRGARALHLTRQMTVAIEPELKRRAERYAWDQGEALSTLMREAARRYISLDPRATMRAPAASEVEPAA
jgi:predicted transcriptional regulator